MTTKSAFSSEEWHALLQAPMNAGLYITLASPSIGDSIKESFTTAKSLAEAVTQTPANELMGALLTEYKNRDMLKQAQPQLQTKDIDQVKSNVRGALQKAGQIVTQKATAAEADHFKRWVYQIAVDTANAAKEGDVLGIGGVRVNEAEKSALAEIATALVVKV